MWNGHFGCWFHIQVANYHQKSIYVPNRNILKHTVSVCNREIESSMFVAGDGVVIWNEHRIRLCITSLPSLLLDGRSRFTALLSILVAYATHEQLTVGWPAVIHIRFYIFLFLFFLSLHSRSLTCSLRHYYTTIAAANTVTSSLIHSFITHIRTLSISFVYLPFSVPFCLCRKLIYFFFSCRHLTNIFHFGILCMGKNSRIHQQRAMTLRNLSYSSLPLIQTRTHAYSHRKLFFGKNKIWKKYEFLPIKCDGIEGFRCCDSALVNPLSIRSAQWTMSLNWVATVCHMYTCSYSYVWNENRMKIAPTTHSNLRAALHDWSDWIQQSTR